jgi:hypothetical protein
MNPTETRGFGQPKRETLPDLIGMGFQELLSGNKAITHEQEMQLIDYMFMDGLFKQAMKYRYIFLQLEDIVVNEDAMSVTTEEFEIIRQQFIIPLTKNFCDIGTKFGVGPFKPQEVKFGKLRKPRYFPVPLPAGTWTLKEREKMRGYYDVYVHGQKEPWEYVVRFPGWCDGPITLPNRNFDSDAAAILPEYARYWKLRSIKDRVTIQQADPVVLLQHDGSSADQQMKERLELMEKLFVHDRNQYGFTEKDAANKIQIKRDGCYNALPLEVTTAPFQPQHHIANDTYKDRENLVSMIAGILSIPPEYIIQNTGNSNISIGKSNEHEVSERKTLNFARLSPIAKSIQNAVRQALFECSGYMMDVHILPMPGTDHLDIAHLVEHGDIHPAFGTFMKLRALGINHEHCEMLQTRAEYRRLLKMYEEQTPKKRSKHEEEEEEEEEKEDDEKKKPTKPAAKKKPAKKPTKKKS